MKNQKVEHSNDLPHPYDSVELLPFNPHGWYSNSKAMQRLFETVRPNIVIEVGSWLGSSARHMASMLAEGGKLYAVDHWKGSKEQQPGEPHWTPSVPIAYQQFLSNVIHAKLTDRIIPVRMGSLEASQYLQGMAVDLIHIDGSHDYDSVYADLTAWYPFVKGHGVLCGDDYHTVKLALDQFALENNLKTIDRYRSLWWYQEKESS